MGEASSWGLEFLLQEMGEVEWVALGTTFSLSYGLLTQRWQNCCQTLSHNLQGSLQLCQPLSCCGGSLAQGSNFLTLQGASKS